MECALIQRLLNILAEHTHSLYMLLNEKKNIKKESSPTILSDSQQRIQISDCIS